MNLLYKTRCYLCGNMEFGVNKTEWRKDITAIFRRMNIIVFNPYIKPFINSSDESEETIKNIFKLREEGKIEEVHNHMKRVVSDDLNQIDISNFIVCFIQPTVPTFGSMTEITYANLIKRPIYIIVDGGVTKTPIWLLGMIRPKYFFNNLEELSSHISKMDSGEIPLDSPRWKLLKHEYLI